MLFGSRIYFNVVPQLLQKRPGLSLENRNDLHIAKSRPHTVQQAMTMPVISPAVNPDSLPVAVVV